MIDILKRIVWGIVLFLTFVIVIPMGLVYIIFEFIINEVWQWIRN